MTGGKTESEAAIERFLGVQVRACGGQCYKFASPACAGVPDRIVILPGGVVVFVEVKSAKGRLSTLQKLTIKNLQQVGALVAVVYSKSEVTALLQEFTRTQGAG